MKAVTGPFTKPSTFSKPSTERSGLRPTVNAIQITRATMSGTWMPRSAGRLPIRTARAAPTRARMLATSKMGHSRRSANCSDGRTKTTSR